jgi:hypothetical protein
MIKLSIFSITYNLLEIFAKEPVNASSEPVKQFGSSELPVIMQEFNQVLFIDLPETLLIFIMYCVSSPCLKIC